MKTPTGAIEEIRKSIRPLDGEKIKCGVTWQALDEVLKFTEWAIGHIADLEADIANDQFGWDYEDDLEPKGDQW